jgi:hypothetical protein
MATMRSPARRQAEVSGQGGRAPTMPVHPARFLPLGLGLLALLAALWGGLVRLGAVDVAPGRTLAATHGPLMVSGFLGTLIGLERAVAVGRRWAYLAPMLSAMGAALLLAGLPIWVGALAMSAAGLVLLAAFIVILRRVTAAFTLAMALGALAWLGGNLLWLSDVTAMPRAVPWWVGFFVLTIAGERLELSRLLLPSARTRAWFALAVGVVVAGFGVGLADADLGARLLGLGLVALAIWLGWHDIARRTLRRGGLPRFIAVCLLLGYAWLGVGGLLLLRDGALIGGPRYDAALHSVFLGFVFSMVIAHAPVILPAVTGRAVPFRPFFYVHLGLLHLSLLVRVGGDLAGWTPVRQVGGTVNVVAVLLFLAATLVAARSAARAAGPDSG